MLPRPPLEAAPPASASTAPAGRVLLVDDNADMREYTRRLLGPWFQVELAADGATALTAALRDPPDLVLTDVMMPGLDGYEAARRIRARTAGRDLVLIALTGWGQPSDRERSRAAGIDQHLVKPVDPGRLLEILQDPSTSSRS